LPYLFYKSTHVLIQIIYSDQLKMCILAKNRDFLESYGGNKSYDNGSDVKPADSILFVMLNNSSNVS
jgi:hypothetical protein